jgi:hypothetical protein
LSALNVLVICHTSPAVAQELKIIIDCIAGTVVSATSESELPIPEMALPNLSFISSNDNHHHIILLNNDRGVSHNKASVPKIVQTVIQAFAQNHIFLLV